MAVDLKLFDAQRQELASFNPMSLDPRSRSQEFRINDAAVSSFNGQKVKGT